LARLNAFTREDLWQTMHKVKARRANLPRALITHDLREFDLLPTKLVVLS